MVDVCPMVLNSAIKKYSRSPWGGRLVAEFSLFESLCFASWVSLLWPSFWMEEQKCGRSVGEVCEEGVFLLQGELGGRSEGKQDKFSWRFRGVGEVKNKSGHLP